MKEFLQKLARVSAVIIALAVLMWFAELYIRVLLVTYGLYLVVFSVKGIRDRYEKGSKAYKALTYIGMPFVLVGLPTDWLLNMLSTLPFWDPPRTWSELFTGRMQRYLRYETPGSLRYEIAYFVCRYILHPVDKYHCGVATP